MVINLHVKNGNLIHMHNFSKKASMQSDKLFIKEKHVQMKMICVTAQCHIALK
jgi:hypothetical protein